MSREREREREIHVANKVLRADAAIDDHLYNLPFIYLFYIFHLISLYFFLLLYLAFLPPITKIKLEQLFSRLLKDIVISFLNWFSLTIAHIRQD